MRLTQEQKDFLVLLLRKEENYFSDNVRRAEETKKHNVFFHSGHAEPIDEVLEQYKKPLRLIREILDGLL